MGDFNAHAARGRFLDDSVPMDVRRAVMERLAAADIANLAEVNAANRDLVRAEYQP